MPVDLTIDRLHHDDLVDFFRMAAIEEWVCDPWEFEFTLQTNPGGCFAARSDGRCLGFVTSIVYERSGWIGNLLVARECRGQGIGRRLFEVAMGRLHDSGVATVWITASADGIPLYESLGFSTIDTIQRWRGDAGATNDSLDYAVDFAAVEMMDAAGWGDSRLKLLQPLLSRGRLILENGGFLLLQGSTAGTQIGPWGAVSEKTATDLLNKACGQGTAATSLFLDAPAGNHCAGRLLADRGFAVTGSTQLMYHGVKPAYDPSQVFALASMGSMG